LVGYVIAIETESLNQEQEQMLRLLMQVLQSEVGTKISIGRLPKNWQNYITPVKD
jgi:hypothetical protein